MSVLKKLLVGKVSKTYRPKNNPIQKRILNIKSIWHNDHQDDNGIEKIARLFLSTSQLFSPEFTSNISLVKLDMNTKI